MTTVEQVALAALADLGESSTNLVNGVRWVNERISQVASRKMKHRRRIGGLVIPAPLTAGTITATQNSDIITGNATALAAWLGVDFDGAFIQLANSGTWYRVVQNLSSDGLRIDQPFVDTTTSGASYRIVFRTITLPEEAAFLGHFAHNRLRREVRLRSQSQLDLHYGDRPFVTSGPAYYSLFGEREGKKIVEFYPYSTQAEYLLFTYWEVPPKLEKEAIVPVPFTEHDLKIGVKADIWEYKAATATDKDVMAFYANMSMKQETRWKEVLNDIMRRDRDVDDLVLLLKKPAPHLAVNWNAHTEVYFRGARP